MDHLLLSNTDMDPCQLMTSYTKNNDLQTGIKVIIIVYQDQINQI